MFTMMNNARLNVGAQGVAIAERATQQAIAYAQERRQGQAPGQKGGMSPIADLPDVRRMLLTMRGLTQAARALCLLTAEAIDRAHRSQDPEARRKASERASILTPVAKAFSTDIGVEVASLGVQVHGGMGFIEETGAAQYLRDARIAPIYEGTNGIQAIDLVTRKLPLSDGKAVGAIIAGMRETAQKLVGMNSPAFGQMGARLRDAVDALDRATQYMLGAVATAPADALAGATPLSAALRPRPRHGLARRDGLGGACGGHQGRRRSRPCGAHRAGALLRREHRDRRAGPREPRSPPAPPPCRKPRWRSPLERHRRRLRRASPRGPRRARRRRVARGRPRHGVRPRRGRRPRHRDRPLLGGGRRHRRTARDHRGGGARGHRARRRRPALPLRPYAAARRRPAHGLCAARGAEARSRRAQCLRRQ